MILGIFPTQAPLACCLVVRNPLLRQVSRALQSIERIAEKRKVRHRVEVINQDPPATCSQKVLHTACSSQPVICTVFLQTQATAEHCSKHISCSYCHVCLIVRRF